MIPATPTPFPTPLPADVARLAPDGIDLWSLAPDAIQSWNVLPVEIGGMVQAAIVLIIVIFGIIGVLMFANSLKRSGG